MNANSLESKTHSCWKKDTPVTARLVPYESLNALQRQQVEAIEVQPEQTRFSGDIHGALHTLLSRPGPGVKGFALLADAVPGLLGQAPLHALTLGFFASMLLGMAARVTMGHSGRPVAAGKELSQAP